MVSFRGLSSHQLGMLVKLRWDLEVVGLVIVKDRLGAANLIAFRLEVVVVVVVVADSKDC